MQIIHQNVVVVQCLETNLVLTILVTSTKRFAVGKSGEKVRKRIDAGLL